MLSLFLLSLSLTVLPYYSEAVTCQNCHNFNGIVCVNAPDCQGNYCLYEEITQSSGQISIRKSCVTSPIYVYDDGYTGSTINTCMTRTTSLGRYCIKVCNDAFHCNSRCVGIANNLVVPTVPPPIVSQLRTCYMCISEDGEECHGTPCQGNFCFYERSESGSSVVIRKGCLQDALLKIDDGTVIETVDVCEVRYSAFGSRYRVKICADRDYCNEQCVPGMPTPQRLPLVSCYSCESTTDCFTGQCQGEFCLFEMKTQYTTGQKYYRKTCSFGPYNYPDNTITRDINTCEHRRINDVDYDISVCNTMNNCNAACEPGNQKLVQCEQCQTNNQNNCVSQGYCRAQACIYERIQYASGQTTVRKDCSNDFRLQYPDGTFYNSNGKCEHRTIHSDVYSAKLCTSDRCNSDCLDGITPTTTVVPFPLTGGTVGGTVLTSAALLLTLSFITI